MADREKLIELIEKAHDTVQEKFFEVDFTYAKAIAIEANVLIANGVTIQKWISVTERLPERDGKYLCNYHFGEHRNMTFTQVLDYYATDKAPHFQHENSGCGMKVSHWMPLPEPAKGE